MHIGKRFKKVHRIGGRSWKNFFISRSCIGNIWGAFFNNLSNTSSDNKNISVQTYVLEIGGLKIEDGGKGNPLFRECCIWSFFFIHIIHSCIGAVLSKISELKEGGDPFMQVGFTFLMPSI